MTKLFLVDPDSPGPEWQPWAGVRPLAELRAGAFRIWERWQRVVGTEQTAVVAKHAARFADVGSLPVVDRSHIAGPAVVALSTFAPVARPIAIPSGARGLATQGSTVAWILESGEKWTGPSEVVDPLEIRGLKLTGAYDVVTACERLLEDDCAVLQHDQDVAVPAGSIVLGNPAGVVALTAMVEPHVVFDVRKGAIILEPDAVVRAGTRLEGPLYVGPHSWILGGAVRHSAIGPHCRVHGEVSSSTFLGYANKSHDGFVGHSVVGQWVNLGASTVTSNLKNTYGEVRLDLPTGRIKTGRMNLGTLFGDHVKTSIGSLLSTGTVIGAGANVTASPIPKFVPAFAWDSPSTRLDRTRFLEIAARVMPRRGVDLTPEILASLSALYDRQSR